MAFQRGDQVIIDNPLSASEDFRGAKAIILHPNTNRHGDLDSYNAEIEGHPHPQEGRCHILYPNEITAAENVIEH